jgi:hypothetical protein
MQASNLAMLVYKIALQNNLITSANKSSIKEQLEIIKTRSLEYIRYKALAPNTNDLIIGNEFINSQIYREINTEKVNNEALSNGLSIVNFTNCLDIVKQYYNLTDIDLLTITKTDIDPSLMDGGNYTNSSLNYVDINLYFNNLQVRMNMSMCDNIKIKTPIKEGGMNLTDYYNYKNQSIDILDPGDPLFTSRCYTYELNGYDTTINMRRRYLFPNKTILCNNNCTYAGIDENNYIECDCSGDAVIHLITLRLWIILSKASVTLISIL